MKKEELIAAGCMVPDTLQEAMRYSGREMKVIEGSREELVSLIYQLLRENGKENTYFDFYFGTLSKEEKQKALSVLSIEQASYLCGLNLPDSREDVYFSYEETLFAIAVRLSVTEMLFSSFYFPMIRKMVWSSFEGKFLMFWYGEAEKCKS